MAPDKPEPDSFLALIERRIAALKALADSYRTAVSVGALGQPGDTDGTAFDVSQGGAGGVAFDLPTGALLGKSIPAAVKLYLAAVKKKQSLREIATALKEGGVESTAANFENTVNSALIRLKSNGEVLRFKDGWALAEFYPESLRNRIAEKDTKPAKAAKRSKSAKNKKKSPAATAAAKPENAKHQIAVAPAGDKPSRAPVVARILGSRNDGATLTELLALVQQAGVASSRKDVWKVLERLCEQGRAEKRVDGRYYPRTGAKGANQAA